MGVLSGFEPEKVFYFFEELCKIPHGTGNTKQISDYCVEFAKERGLEWFQDSANNVIIKKPGTPGYENSAPVILQGHLDMVCEKTDDSDHDFLNDPLKLVVKDNYIYADGTTLGADDGIAVAMTLAVLNSHHIVHPPIEAVFTTEEEIGMDGAEALDFDRLKGRLLINIDSEEEGILTVGCAGGFRYTSHLPLNYVKAEGAALKLEIKGLLGGHSGIEIHKQRGNANVMMGRLLAKLNAECDVHIVETNGGTKNNVITRNNTTIICVPESDKEKCLDLISEMYETWKSEYGNDEPEFEVIVSDTTAEAMADKDTSVKAITYFALMPDGAMAYEREIAGQVETSLNAGIVKTENGSIRIYHMIRSSVESKKLALRDKLDVLINMVGGKGEMEGNYPAWAYRRESALRDTMVKVFKKCYGREAEIVTVHAGLECGLFLGKCPDLDCVSFGPDMFDVHSSNEHLDIDSVTRSFKYLREILKELK